MKERRLKLVGQKTDCDRMIFWQRRSAAIDLKTFEHETRLSRSMLTEHQVIALHEIYCQGISAGHVVWYRKLNKVVFHNANQLWAIWNHQGSFGADDGLLLGQWDDFDTRKVLMHVPPSTGPHLQLTSL
jgi:penicillin-binding protein-related factor A (putative recombinase)